MSKQGKKLVQVQLTMEELHRVIYGLNDLAEQFRANENYDVLANKLEIFYQQHLKTPSETKKTTGNDQTQVITALVELEVPREEMNVLEPRLQGEVVKVKSGEYENQVTGTIVSLVEVVFHNPDAALEGAWQDEMSRGRASWSDGTPTASRS
jgi:hypothetical protein